MNRTPSGNSPSASHNALSTAPATAATASDAGHATPAAPAPATSEQARQQVDIERRFLNDATHQLRTPLAGIISQAELALQETDTAKLHQRIEKILAAAQRGSQLVRQMLALARSEAQAPASTPAEHYDIAQLAREVAREWIPKSLALHKDLGYEGLDSAIVRGNRFMMREAIHNLIDNALIYTPANGIITVSVKHSAPAADANTADAIILEVADNGTGVPTEHLEHVFQRFWRADEQSTHGSGLGLPLVARIAAQHGGHASAHNAQPHGFIVRLTLPAAPTPSAP